MSMIDDEREKNPRKRYPHNTLNFNVINVIIHNSLWILTDSSHSWNVAIHESQQSFLNMKIGYIENLPNFLVEKFSFSSSFGSIYIL